MNSGMSWQDLLALVANATGETLYMMVIATFFTVLIGLPLGILLFAARPNGVLPAPRLNTLIGWRGGESGALNAVRRLADCANSNYPLDYRYHTR